MSFSRTNDLGLLVALGPDNTASGEMFWDDGKSIGEGVNLYIYVLYLYPATFCVCHNVTLI